jgi:hypothetical protein
MVARGFVLGVTVTAWTSVALAQPRTPVPPLVNATEVVKLAPDAGFIDDPIAADDQRIAYVVTDAATRAELHVITLATRQDATIDVASITLHPVGLELAGNRALVIGLADRGQQTATMIELTAQGKKPAGAIVYKLAPASHITVIQRDGKRVIALHRATDVKDATRHEVELVALDSGKRIAAGRPFDVDARNTNKALDLHVNHWSDGMTRAYGVKGGDWDKKENQRTPDVEAVYDLVAGKLVDRHPIEDLFEQRKRYQTLADVGDKIDFLHTTWDNSAVQLWHAGRPKSLELDQPLSQYDPKSLQGIVAADGTAWFTLKVDPVNAEAVARKKADPEYLDVFHATGDGKAVRKARLLATGVRHRFGTIGAGDRFWLLERSNSFDRGGRSVAVYQLTTP